MKSSSKIIKVVISICLLSLIFTCSICVSFAAVVGSSMNPTYEDGTTLLLDKLSDVKNNDCVAIYSKQLNEILCKRVIALQGDTVEIKDGVVFLNGKQLEESFNKDTETNLKKTTISEGKVFVMGDNREHSIDSRVLGVLNTSDVKGKVLFDLHISSTILKYTLFCIMIVAFTVLAWEMLSDRKNNNK